MGAWNEPGLNAKGEWIEGNWMLLCDGCDTARHTLCCSPPLLAVREGRTEGGGGGGGVYVCFPWPPVTCNNVQLLCSTARYKH